VGEGEGGEGNDTSMNATKGDNKDDKKEDKKVTKRMTKRMTKRQIKGRPRTVFVPHRLDEFR
jgi:hypothetical protein